MMNDTPPNPDRVCSSVNTQMNKDALASSTIVYLKPGHDLYVPEVDLWIQPDVFALEQKLSQHQKKGFLHGAVFGCMMCLLGIALGIFTV